MSDGLIVACCVWSDVVSLERPHDPRVEPAEAD